MKSERYSNVGIPKDIHEQFKKFAEENSVIMGQFAGKAIIEKMERITKN